MIDIKTHIEFVTRVKGTYDQDQPDFYESLDKILEHVKEVDTKLDKIRNTIKLAEDWCKDQSNELTDGSICISAMKDIRRFCNESQIGYHESQSNTLGEK